MKTIFQKLTLTYAIVIFLFLSPITAHSGPSSSEYECGGVLEQATWTLWDNTIRATLETEIIQRRFAIGDTYALYDLQTHLQNAVWMALSCERWQRLRELATMLSPIFDKLEPLDTNSPEKAAWICRAGQICNTRNKLIDTEVALVSQQGLGLLTTVAAALSQSPNKKDRMHPFVRNTAYVASSHILRWQTPEIERVWLRNSKLSINDLQPTTRNALFTDSWLWILAIQANLALIADKSGQWFPSNADRVRLSNGYRLLSVLFNSRLGRVGPKGAIDFDRGFWRYHSNNRFSGYSNQSPPAVCKNGSEIPEFQINPSLYPPPASIGWDISHSRRLVHLALAMDRAQRSIRRIYWYDSQSQPHIDLSRGFSQQIVQNIWNQDISRPLFANYWSGDNGWYRVGYTNGTGRCYPGTPPSGLSSSIATGGYMLLGSHSSNLSTIGRRLFALFQSREDSDRAFVAEHYPIFSKDADLIQQSLANFSFWSSLVHKPE